jgi:hypothetical protein
MKTVIDAIKAINENAVVNVSANSLDANAVDAQITWLEGTAEISNADIQAKLDELRTADANKPNLKASAKAKLIAGEALTEEEANVMIGG